MKVDEVEFADQMENTNEEEDWVAKIRNRILEMIKKAIDKHEEEHHHRIVLRASQLPRRRTP